MTVVGVYQAKTHLSKLLDRVAKEEHITITRLGVPVAELVPPAAKPCVTAAEAVAAIRKLRRGNRLWGVTIRQLIEEGRRY